MAANKLTTLTQLKTALLRLRSEITKAAQTAQASGVTFADGQKLADKHYAELSPEEYAELEKMLK